VAEASAGVGLHADDAAVNVNIWLTPDGARSAGGGLDVFRETPGRGLAASAFNRVPSGPLRLDKVPSLIMHLTLCPVCVCFLLEAPNDPYDERSRKQ